MNGVILQGLSLTKTKGAGIEINTSACLNGIAVYLGIATAHNSGLRIITNEKVMTAFISSLNSTSVDVLDKVKVVVLCYKLYNLILNASLLGSKV